jgi:hypothetical protein
MRLLPCASCGPGAQFTVLALLLLLLLGYQHQRYAASWDQAPDEEDDVRGLRVVQETVWQWVSSWFVGAFAGRASDKAWMGEDEDIAEESIKQKPHWYLRGDPGGKSGEVSGRRLQLLEGAALIPLDRANFTTAGLRIAPPYLGFSNCFFYQQCTNITTNYGLVSRCKNQRVCEVCTGYGTHRTCQFFRITGNPSTLGARTPFTTNPLVD